MNKKGFTTVELLLTMVVVLTIMVSITSVTYTYRDRSKYEEIKTEITDYKNMVTKIIYDDILDSDNKAVQIEKVNDTEYNIVKMDNTIINLKVIDENNRIGIKYNNTDYIIPASNKSLITFERTIYQSFPNSSLEIYSLDIVFSHKSLEDDFKIHLVVSK